MKKRGLLLTVALVLILSLVLTGCGGSQTGGGQETGSDAPATGGGTLELLMGTGGTAGTYYPLGGAMANVWNENIEGINITIQPTGASVENIRLLDAGEADLIMCMNNIADDAWNGVNSFEGQVVQSFRAIGVIYPEIIQGVGLVEKGVLTVEDQIGKTVAGGPPGSGTAVTTPHIFEAHGISTSDMTIVNDTFGDAVDKMKDGHLDAAWNTLSAPAAAIVDLLTAKEVAFLEIKGEALEKLQEAFPLVTPHVIPAGTYNYQGKDYPDIHTIALQAVLYVREDLDEDLAYQLTKVMYEKTADIAKAHATGEQIKLENALNGITTDFHPGAIKYYKEKGMM